MCILDLMEHLKSPYLDCQLKTNAFRSLHFYNQMIFDQVITFLRKFDILQISYFLNSMS